MKRRTGISLVEILTVIAVLSIVMSLATVVIHGLLGIKHSSSEAFEHQASLGRLAETFRNDVHAADEINLIMASKNNPAKQFELLAADAQPIVYTAEGGALVRIVKSGDRTIRRSFQLPAGAAVDVETQRQGKATLVTLIITPAETPNRAKGRPSAGLRACAQLARDRCLAEITIEPVATEETSEPSDDKAAAEPEEETSDE